VRSAVAERAAKYGEQRQADRGRVGEHVPRVGQQREASGEDAAHDVDDHVGQLHAHGDRQGTDARAAKLVHGVVPVGVIVMAAGAVAAGFRRHGFRPRSGFHRAGPASNALPDNGLRSGAAVVPARGWRPPKVSASAPECP